MRWFCTYFDSNYAARGRSLVESLSAQLTEFRIFILCMDNVSEQYIKQLKLDQCVIITLENVFYQYPALKDVRNERSVAEFYFTCTPFLPRFILDHYPDISLITYLDADLYFFSSPEPIFNEIEDASIGIIEHKFSSKLKRLEIFGKFNVGWVSFKNDDEGMACVKEWSEQCLEWCYDRLNGEKYADQKYLDSWPVKYSKCVVISNPGANVALWNIENHRIDTTVDRLLVDNLPLIFYHFHGLRRISSRVWKVNFSSYNIKPKPVLIEKIYKPYLELLESRLIPHSESSNFRWKRLHQRWRGQFVCLLINILGAPLALRLSKVLRIRSADDYLII